MDAFWWFALISAPLVGVLAVTQMLKLFAWIEYKRRMRRFNTDFKAYFIPFEGPDAHEGNT